jgi:hypothetical protein
MRSYGIQNNGDCKNGHGTEAALCSRGHQNAAGYEAFHSFSQHLVVLLGLPNWRLHKRVYGCELGGFIGQPMNRYLPGYMKRTDKGNDS